MRRAGSLFGLLWALPLLWLCPLSADASADPLENRITIALPAQSLGDALRTLAIEANLQILFDADLVAGRRAELINDTLSVRAAATK